MDGKGTLMSIICGGVPSIDLMLIDEIHGFRCPSKFACRC